MSSSSSHHITAAADPPLVAPMMLFAPAPTTENAATPSDAVAMAIPANKTSAHNLARLFLEFNDATAYSLLSYMGNILRITRQTMSERDAGDFKELFETISSRAASPTSHPLAKLLFLVGTFASLNWSSATYRWLSDCMAKFTHMLTGATDKSSVSSSVIDEVIDSLVVPLMDTADEPPADAAYFRLMSFDVKMSNELRARAAACPSSDDDTAIHIRQYAYYLLAASGAKLLQQHGRARPHPFSLSVLVQMCQPLITPLPSAVAAANRGGGGDDDISPDEMNAFSRELVAGISDKLEQTAYDAIRDLLEYVAEKPTRCPTMSTILTVVETAYNEGKFSDVAVAWYRCTKPYIRLIIGMIERIEVTTQGYALLEQIDAGTLDRVTIGHLTHVPDDYHTELHNLGEIVAGSLELLFTEAEMIMAAEDIERRVRNVDIPVAVTIPIAERIRLASDGFDVLRESPDGFRFHLDRLIVLKEIVERLCHVNATMMSLAQWNIEDDLMEQLIGVFSSLNADEKCADLMDANGADMTESAIHAYSINTQAVLTKHAPSFLAQMTRRPQGVLRLFRIIRTNNISGNLPRTFNMICDMIDSSVQDDLCLSEDEDDDPEVTQSMLSDALHKHSVADTSDAFY
ncbi:MAG: hypothetical protein WC763_07505 [Candidatus Paceibacterota bacterium]|jgi:hypothetical protein